MRTAVPLPEGAGDGEIQTQADALQCLRRQRPGAGFREDYDAAGGSFDWPWVSTFLGNILRHRGKPHFGVLEATLGG